MGCKNKEAKALYRGRISANTCGKRRGKAMELCPQSQCLLLPSYVKVGSFVSTTSLLLPPGLSNLVKRSSSWFLESGAKISELPLAWPCNIPIDRVIFLVNLPRRKVLWSNVLSFFTAINVETPRWLIAVNIHRHPSTWKRRRKRRPSVVDLEGSVLRYPFGLVKNESQPESRPSQGSVIIYLTFTYMSLIFFKAFSPALLWIINHILIHKSSFNLFGHFRYNGFKNWVATAFQTCTRLLCFAFGSQDI